MKKLNPFVYLLAFAVLLVSATSCQSDSKDNNAADAENNTAEVTDQAAGDNAGATTNLIEEASIPTTTVEWETKSYDFGDIQQNAKQKYVFKFTNTGDNPLVITEAKAGCGCTVPKKPEEPVAPGESGEIEVEYNGSGNGKISKNVTVRLNTEAGTEILNISANVLGAAMPQ